MTLLKTLAPGKVNLCLFVSEPRGDGLHELVSVIQPVSLADELTLEIDPAGIESDVVICAGVKGPNLAARALALYRESTGWDGPPLRLTIIKAVPVAAGMGGGSSDAAAALRLIAFAAESPHDPVLSEIAPRLGADVPALLWPRQVLVAGAGERVEDRSSDFALPGDEISLEESFGLVVLPSNERLSTPDVYREFDRIGKARTHTELERISWQVRQLEPWGLLPSDLMSNDLQSPAVNLCPEVNISLALVHSVGADDTLVSGSGPTVFGVFRGVDGHARATVAAEVINNQGVSPAAVSVRPVGPVFGVVTSVRITSP